MTLAELFFAQLTDPFRIALAVGLVVTMLRTQAVTGTALPLAAGVVFIAAIIPLSLRPADGALATAIGVGLLSTALIVGIATLVATLVLRGRGR